MSGKKTRARKSSPGAENAREAAVPQALVLKAAAHGADAVSAGLRCEAGAENALMKSPARFINRELSWIKFNRRVLEESENLNHPVLERLRFLSISGGNLDEFYMVRVAGLRAMVRNGVTSPGQDGLTPSQQLAEIYRDAGQLMDEQQVMCLDGTVEIGRASCRERV